MSQSQNLGGYPEEGPQTGQTECGVAIRPCEERQGEDRGLETGPYQGPSRLQCAFNRSRWAPLNLVASFQTELALDTNMAVGDTRAVVGDTHTMVADIHRSVFKGQEVTSNNKNLVGVTCYPSKTDFLPPFRLKKGLDIEYSI